MGTAWRGISEANLEIKGNHSGFGWEFGACDRALLAIQKGCSKSEAEGVAEVPEAELEYATRGE